MQNDINLVFSALANPARRGIMDRLILGRTTVKELASPYDMTPGAISQHLKILEDAGLLKRTVKGRAHHCELEQAGMQHAMHWMKQHERFWQSRLDALATFVEQYDDKQTTEAEPGDD
jgi:DNA-binding transcriptional ArsR family regulator